MDRGRDREVSTARKLAAGEHTTGVPTLLDLLPAASEARKARLVELLGVGKQRSNGYRTEGGLAELLIHLHPNIRYVEERKAWFFYDGKRWKHSLNGTEVEAMADNIGRASLRGSL